MKSTTYPAACVFVLALELAAAPASATEVRGALDVSESWRTALGQRTNIPPEPPTLFWEVGNGAASIEPPVVDVANEFGVLVRRTDQEPLDPRSSDQPITIELRNMAFQPAIVFVPEGQNVVIKNLDLFDHDLVVEPEKGGEPLPKQDIDPGRSFSVHFNASGLYVLRCNNFEFLRGYILVDKAPARFVNPSDDGTFSLGDLPPGQYSLTVFNATAQASAAANQTGWVANPCTIEVPAPAPPPPAVPAPPPETPEARPRPGAETPPPTPPPPPPLPPAFQVGVRLVAQGTTEKVECTGSFPQPPAAAAPAQPPAGAGSR